MPMMTAQREPSSPTAAAVDGRSPFVRLTELIVGIEPGTPVINLSVGVPQHPIPSFGATENLRGPVDPESEVPVLNGTREGWFLPAIAAKPWVKPRAGKPAVLIPN